jgi:hypothetical protein
VGAKIIVLLEQVAEGAAGGAITRQANVVFLQDMICRYLWSGRQYER